MPWPQTATRDAAGRLHVGGVAVTDLAERFGTPLWVVDEHDIRSRCREYRRAFPDGDVAYASKAWCTRAILEIITEEGLLVDVASEGELHTARVAGVPMGRVLFHGNNKSMSEIRLAAELRVGRVVADSFEELDRLEAVGAETGHTFAVWLRVTPGIDAHTHEYVRTGHDDTKFGFTLSLGHADAAIGRALALDHVEVVGIHAHIGSQVFGTEPFVANAETLVELLARWREQHGLTLREVNVGGGMAIRYTHADHPVEVEAYGRGVTEAVRSACERHGLPVPRLSVEPGRAIVAPSTITLYRIGTVKELPGLRTYVSVNGGMSDNIRPALYGAEHEVALASRHGDEQRRAFTVVGKHCEPGDLVAERASLPADLHVGDLLAVAATGAYTESMASNYNRVPRPAAVLVADGGARLIVRRETLDDLVARDLPLR